MARPVLIGHGLGGLLVLTLAAETHAAGVIAIDALPAGVMAPVREPTAGPGAAALSREEFRVVYGSAVSRAESDLLYEQWAIPAPQWALREGATPETLAPRSGAHATNSSRGPVLLMASGESRRRAAAQYTSGEPRLLAAVSDVADFPDRGPSLVIDSGWRPVAESCLSWNALADHGIDEVTGHYAQIIEQLPAPPVLIGHSFGGMIAEKLLGEDYGRGSDRHRRGPNQGRSAAAAVGAALHVAGVQEPDEQAQGRHR